MNIKEELLKENSKQNALKILKYIDNDVNKFDDLMQLFFSDTYRVTQRAAFVIDVYVKKENELLIPYYEQMIVLMEKGASDAIIRNIARILQLIDLPEEYLARAFDICYKLAFEPESAIAIKAFSLGILKNICIREPELKDEVLYLIETIAPNASSGLKNRCYHVGKALRAL